MTSSEDTLTGRRVLIVEDDALIAMGVEEEVRQLGCTDIFVAYNKGQALHEIDSYKPQFAVIDVALTDNGVDYDIADRLAERAIPFIFSSGHLASELPDRHVGRPFVGKPVKSDEFAEAIAMALLPPGSNI